MSYKTLGDSDPSACSCGNYRLSGDSTVDKGVFHSRGDCHTATHRELYGTDAPTDEENRRLREHLARRKRESLGRIRNAGDGETLHSVGCGDVCCFCGGGPTSLYGGKWCRACVPELADDPAALKEYARRVENMLATVAHDPAVDAVIAFLVSAAEEHGFTPLHLKQMAARAGVELELRNPSQFRKRT